MILPFDEVDALITKVKSSEKTEVKELEDSVLDLLILDYVYGTAAASEMLGIDIQPDMDEMKASVEKKVAGKDFRQRIREYAPSNDVESIARVIDTDSTRVFNEALLNGAKKAGATTKTWNTMLDDRVRDAHIVLQSVTIPLDAEFYTDGDHAPAPGQFNEAYLNCGCRCWLTVQ